MVAPAVPDKSTGMPLGSLLKCAVLCGCTSNAGVPWSNVRVTTSPFTTAETIAGAVLVLDSGAGQFAEAVPALVHASGDGPGEGVGEICAGCAEPPQAERKPRTTMTADSLADFILCVGILITSVTPHYVGVRYDCEAIDLSLIH